VFNFGRLKLPLFVFKILPYFRTLPKLFITPMYIFVFLLVYNLLDYSRR
jgi:hypothetical protein